MLVQHGVYVLMPVVERDGRPTLAHILDLLVRPRRRNDLYVRRL